jgi:acetamidase/formamidase
LPIAVTRHQLPLGRRTLHGHFSRALSPVLEIDSGDEVVFRTLDARWSDGDAGRQFEPRDPELDAGHALSGPVALRGSRPGMALAVHVEELVTEPTGWTAVAGTPLNEALGVTDGKDYRMSWELDPLAGIARNDHGLHARMRPFLGVMGVAPAEQGRHSTAPPRPSGGNIDCRELVVGSTLYLPVAVPGALFSTGDGHAAQGDGESSGTAIECGMARARLRFELRPDTRLAMPWAQTPAGLVTFGFDEDLDAAMEVALSAMLDVLVDRYDLARREALALSSTVVELRITQVVNGVRGVHALLPADAIF